MGKKFETTIDGKKITLKDLQSVMSGAKALIINRILYYSITKKFIVCNDSGDLYIRKSLREWSSDLERWYENGNKRCVSKSCVSKVFGDLLKDGVLIKLDANDSRVAAYKVSVEELKNRLKHLFFDVHFRSTLVGNSEHFDRKIATNLEQKCNESTMKVGRKCNESTTKVDIKTQATQGVEPLFGPGTYTYTSTYTNNKSHKSEEFGLRENFSTKREFRDDKSDKSIFEKSNFIKNNKKNSELFQQSDIQNTINDVQNVGIICKKESNCSKQKCTIVQDMFEIWQEEFPLLEEQLNLEKSSWLKSAYDSVFNKDLQEFRTYLRRVKTSKFITEKPHLLNIKWLLDFGHIAEIRAGNYSTCAPDNPSTELNNLKNDCLEMIELKRAPRICMEIRKRMLEKLGPHLYTQWFGSLHIEINDDSGEFDCMDYYFNRNSNAAKYANAVHKEIQAETNARYERANITTNTQNKDENEIVKIDFNQFCKPKTINPRSSAPLQKSQMNPEITAYEKLFSKK
jgi:hypothetical protein